MASEKKKGGFSSLFGSRGQGDTAYRIIYMTITCYMTDKGLEQMALLLYGDDQDVIFTNTIPAGAILYTYKDDLDGPYIKLTKSLMPGATKAEIWLPKGYSFMSPSMPSIGSTIAPMVSDEVVPKIQKAIPQPTVQYIPATKSLVVSEVNADELPEPEMSTDDVIKIVNENEAKAKADMEEREARGETFDESQFLPQSTTTENKTAVIAEDAEFGATFDEDVLNERIQKFLAKNENKHAVTTQSQVKEVDSRTIEEVKRESVEDEMERLMKNDEAMLKIKEAADKDSVNTGVKK